MVVFCTIWPAFALIVMSMTVRMPYYKEPIKFYDDLIRWIKDENEELKDIDTNKILYTASEDRIVRICVANKILLEKHRVYDIYSSYSSHASGGYNYKTATDWTNYK